ncbi:hypothetical protein [Streptomyces sp. NBC_01264]|uniref:hypothetical protein n=1 Tax=Streptomyces sp. NBC_01264 TaxID=2903804 RepID=UPI003D300375
MLNAMETDLADVVAEQPDPVLEQLLSPLVVHTTPAHEELVPQAPACLAGLIEAEHGAEHGAAAGIDGGRVERDVEALHGVLEAAQAASRLPEHVDAFDALDEFVVRRRVR